MEGFWVRDRAKTHGTRKVVEGNLRDRSHVLIGIDENGNYECTVEEPLELDAVALENLLGE